MASPLDPIILTFGGGLNINRRSLDIEPQECTEGENFDLDPDVAILAPRQPFDLVATAPNNQEIRGFVQYANRTDTITTLIQAGANVYSWDGASSFTLVGTVNASSRIRGDRKSTDLVNQQVIITDLEKLTVVKTWNGTTFADFSHNLASSLFAKHCLVHGERAFFGNVQSGTDTPHVILGSELSNPGVLTIANRPGSGLSAADPFFFHTLDLHPVNGIDECFGALLISSEQGSLQRLTGADAQDFALNNLYDSSNASGTPAIVNIGNTLIIGTPGRLLAIGGTDAFGSVQERDISLWVNPAIQTYSAWTMAYNRRLQKVYCFPDSQNECWVFHKNLIDQTALLEARAVSPWAKWTTEHSFDFLPSTVMPIRNPITGLEEVYCGDSSGRIFKLEGESEGDGGTEEITVSRTSASIRVPGAEMFDLTGYVMYERLFDVTLTLTFEWQGVKIEDQTITIPLTGNSDASTQAFYNGNFFYGGNIFYGAPFEGQLSLRDFGAAGLSSILQVTAEVTADTEFAIHEIGIQLKASGRHIVP